MSLSQGEVIIPRAHSWSVKDLDPTPCLASQAECGEQVSERAGHPEQPEGEGAGRRWVDEMCRKQENQQTEVRL